MAQVGITTSSMTMQEREFYNEVRQRRSERIERRRRRMMAEQARKERIDRVGTVACAVMGFIFFWLLCMWASL